MIISEGRYYKTRDGRKTYIIGKEGFGGFYGTIGEFSEFRSFNADGRHVFNRKMDLVAEWPSEGPARTRTVTEIVEGVYAGVNVSNVFGQPKGVIGVLIGKECSFKLLNATELRAAAAVLTQLADALEAE